MSSIKISPTALFQIIKDINMGPSTDHAQGRLYGMPSDGQGSPIEVTHAYPDYKKDHNRASHEHDSINSEETDNFTRTHLKNMKKVNYDDENVGWYTSQNCGRRMSFEDLTEQQGHQRDDSSYFCLVVDLSGSSLSLRAFRIHENAMKYLENKDTNKDIFSTIHESMFFDNLLQEYNVSFDLTPLDQIITSQILSSFNLIADVFRLRNPITFQNNVSSVNNSFDKIEKSMKDFNREKNTIKQKNIEYEKWNQERIQTNIKREAKGLPPLPEDDSDAPHPPEPSNKINFISQLYQFSANSMALQEELGEEITKMDALIHLGGSNE